MPLVNPNKPISVDDPTPSPRTITQDIKPILKYTKPPQKADDPVPITTASSTLKSDLKKGVPLAKAVINASNTPQTSINPEVVPVSKPNYLLYAFIAFLVAKILKIF